MMKFVFVLALALAVSGCVQPGMTCDICGDVLGDPSPK